jgi:hypothetical protein
MAASVTHFISLEIFGWGSMLWSSFLAALWHGALIAVIGMEVVIYVALEVGRAVKPWASANEDAARKPLGSIVAVGSTAVGSGLIVTVGTIRGHADLDADLGLSWEYVPRRRDRRQQRTQLL